jgi:hypothetical protein
MSTAPGTAPLPELVVKALGRIALLGLTIGGVLIYLALRQTGPTDPAVTGVIGTFLAITSAAVGGLGAILASTRAIGDPPTPVTVTNAPADPVPTADVPAMGEVLRAGQRRKAKKA